MNRLHDETVKCRVVLYELNVKFVYILIGRVLVFAREPEGGGWAPGDGTYKYNMQLRWCFTALTSIDTEIYSDAKSNRFF